MSLHFSVPWPLSGSSFPLFMNRRDGLHRLEFHDHLPDDKHVRPETLVQYNPVVLELNGRLPLHRNAELSQIVRHHRLVHALHQTGSKPRTCTLHAASTISLASAFSPIAFPLFPLRAPAPLRLFLQNKLGARLHAKLPAHLNRQSGLPLAYRLCRFTVCAIASISLPDRIKEDELVRRQCSLNSSGLSFQTTKTQRPQGRTLSSILFSSCLVVLIHFWITANARMRIICLSANQIFALIVDGHSFSDFFKFSSSSRRHTSTRSSSRNWPHFS